MTDTDNLFENQMYLELSKQKCLELLLIVKDICEKHQLNYWIDGGTLLGSQRHQGFIPWDDDIDICLPKSHYDKLIEHLADYCTDHTNYILFHHKTDVSFNYDFFASTDYLIDGLYPIRVDLIPMKGIKNTPDAIKNDESLTNIYSLYYQGKMKSPNAVLPQHEFLLPKLQKNILNEQQRFMQFYNNYLIQNDINKSTGNTLINYAFNDMSVVKKRPYYTYEMIFPLSRIKFEGQYFNAPNDVQSYLTILYGTAYLTPPPKHQQHSHFYRIYKNGLTAEETKQLLALFFASGVKNFAFNKSGIEKKILVARNFLQLSSGLLIKGKFRSCLYLLRFVVIKLIGKR